MEAHLYSFQLILNVGMVKLGGACIQKMIMALLPLPELWLLVTHLPIGKNDYYFILVF
jgi:hypothetical protein